MDTQNTSIHLRLWHRRFQLLLLSELFLAMSVYVLIPVLGSFLHGSGVRSEWGVYGLMLFAVGLYLPGGFIEPLFQKYSRSHVCQFSILMVAVVMAAAYLMPEILLGGVTFAAATLLLGVFYGLAQMVLLSTLIIDTTDSFQRTEANYVASWALRFALAPGPLLGVAMSTFFMHEALPHRLMLVLSAVLALQSCLLVSAVHFPFKAPDEKQVCWSTDRYALLRGYPLFFTLLLVTMAGGVMIGHFDSVKDYLFLFAGLVVALIAERMIFFNGDLKSEAIAGYILLGTACLIRLTRQDENIPSVVAFLVGNGSGLLTSRYLLFFIKLSRHCERATAQSTYFLGYESGIVIGLMVPYVSGNIQTETAVALGLVVVGLLLYNFVVHNWYLHNKNR